MICDCGARMYVVNTRLHKCGTQTRRQYACHKCKKQIITFEIEQRALHRIEQQGSLRERIAAAVLKAITDTK